MTTDFNAKKRRIRNTTGVDGLGQDWTYEDEATKAAEGSDENAEVSEEEPDAYLLYLQGEHRKYRAITLVMAILGFSLLLMSISLSVNEIVSLSIYNIMMTVANLFIVLMLVFGFTRVRPFKKQMKSYIREHDERAKEEEANREVVSGVVMEKREFTDLDGFYKIFERKIRTELIPETEEYHRLRRVWLAVFSAAGIAGLGAMAWYALDQSNPIGPSIALIIAFILVIVGFYIDRTRMKPLRDAWARKFNTTEFKMRDNM